MDTKAKKIVIILIYLALFVFIISGIYSFLTPKETCFDGIKNQNEEDVDCGGACAKSCDKIEAEDLIIEKTGIVPAGIAGKYDFYAQVNNPNAAFGSERFEYAASLKNSAEEILASVSGSGFILPGEKKYIIENNIDASESPAVADLKIVSSDWVKFNDYYAKPEIKIINKNYSEISGGVGFSEAKGLLKNDSPYDFDSIKIIVILKDSEGSVLGLNSTVMKTVESGEERDFKASWPSHFPGTVGNMEAQPEVNIFDSDTFLKRYYQSHKFQQY